MNMYSRHGHFTALSLHHTDIVHVSKKK